MRSGLFAYQHWKRTNAVFKISMNFKIWNISFKIVLPTKSNCHQFPTKSYIFYSCTVNTNLIPAFQKVTRILEHPVFLFCCTYNLHSMAVALNCDLYQLLHYKWQFGAQCQILVGQARPRSVLVWQKLALSFELSFVVDQADSGIHTTIYSDVFKLEIQAELEFKIKRSIC